MKNRIVPRFASVLATLPFALFALGATTLSAVPVVIDDFTVDLTTATYDDTILTGAIVSANSPGDDMLGDVAEIDVRVNSPGAADLGISGGILKVNNLTNDTYTVIYYDGTGNGDSGQSFNLPDVDLTSHGMNDRLALEFPSISGNVDVAVSVFSDAAHGSEFQMQNVSAAGMLEFPFDGFTPTTGGGCDFASVETVAFAVLARNGESFEIASFKAVAASSPPAAPDTERPALRFLKKSRLKTPRARHKIVGVASDNEAVAKVEVKSRLAKGWRKAKLRASGRWIHRTPRLGSGRNKFKVRAEDVSGNRSRVKRVKAVGR